MEAPLIIMSIFMLLLIIGLKVHNTKLEDESILLMKQCKELHASGTDAHERAVEASHLISRIVELVPIEHKMEVLKEISKSADRLSGKK